MNNKDTELIWETYNYNRQIEYVLNEHDDQTIEELAFLPFVVPALLTAVRVGAPHVIRMIARRGAASTIGGQIAKQQVKKQVTGQALKKMAKDTPGLGKKIGEVITKTADKVKTAAPGAVQSGKELARKTVIKAREVAPGMAKQGKEIAKKGFSKTKEVAPVIATGIKNTAQRAAPHVNKAFKGGANITGNAMKQGAKGAGKLVKNTGKTIVNNPGKSLAAYGAYELGSAALEFGADVMSWGEETWDAAAELLSNGFASVQEAMDWLQNLDIPGIIGDSLETIASFMVENGISLAVILALLYGGYKFLSWIFSDDDDEQPARA